MKPRLVLLTTFVVGLVWYRFAESQVVTKEPSRQVEESDQGPLWKALGTNNIDEVVESSGLAISAYLKNAIWTINDSGHPCHLFLLGTNGKLIGRVQVINAKNVDWEAMAQFEINGEPYLAIADVGDNQRNRSSCQIYLLREPNLGIDDNFQPNRVKLPIQKAVRATTLEFTYPGGPRDCEAVAVDGLANEIWLTEKVYYNAPRSASPGLYVLPLTFTPTVKPLVARRIADFPIRNATGMAFSPDGKRLIIRNYLNAHLYSRSGNESWADVVTKTKPKVVVLPLQRQGEAICFTRDSKSVILTSETKRQTIWQVNLSLGAAPPVTDPPDAEFGKLKSTQPTADKR